MNKNTHKPPYENIKELAEQTFLLWAQIGLLLISVGFACVGLISFIHAHHLKPILNILVRVIGNLFVITGFIFIFFSLVQYRNKLKNPGQFYHTSIDLPIIIGTIISLFGILIFIIIAIDWL